MSDHHVDKLFFHIEKLYELFGMSVDDSNLKEVRNDFKNISKFYEKKMSEDFGNEINQHFDENFKKRSVNIQVCKRLIYVLQLYLEGEISKEKELLQNLENEIKEEEYE